MGAPTGAEAVASCVEGRFVGRIRAHNALVSAMPYLRWLGRYHQTAHSFNRPLESVTITNPIHPLHGQEVVVRSFRQVGKSVRVIVEHPNGGLISLPASETSLEPQAPVSLIKGETPKFDPKLLLSLAEWMQRKDRKATNEISFGQEHQDDCPEDSK